MATAVSRQAKSIRLESNIWQAVELLAKKQNRSLNNFIETLLKEYIEENKTVVSSMEDDTLMSKEEFFARVDAAKERTLSGDYIRVNNKKELRELIRYTA